MLMIFWYSLWYPHQRDQNMASFLHSFWVFYNQARAVTKLLPSVFKRSNNNNNNIFNPPPPHAWGPSACYLMQGGSLESVQQSFHHLTGIPLLGLLLWNPELFLRYRPNGSILVWIIVLINIICLRFVSKLEWESQFWISRIKISKCGAM